MGAYKIFKKYILGTSPKVLVPEDYTVASSLTFDVARVVGLDIRKVYITTKVVKHLYDGKPNDEFNAVLKSVSKVVRYPDHVHLGATSKRGHFIFVKTYEGQTYICSLEKVSVLKEKSISEALFIVTCFWKRSENYLKNYPHVWSWRDDNPSS